MAAVAPAPERLAPASFAARKLRVGVFADGARQPGWIVEAVARAAAAGLADVCVVCLDTSSDAAVAGPAGVPRWLARIDRRFFGGATDWSSLARIDELVPRSRRSGLSGDPGWRLEMAALDLDVAFAVGAIDDAPLDGLARFGTWRYCFGEGHDTDLGAAGVREVVDRADVTASGIRVRRVLHGDDRIVCRSWSRTQPFSLARNRHNVFAKATEFLARALRDVAAGGAAWIEAGEPAGYRSMGETRCHPRDLVRLAARLGARAVQRATSVEQWSLAFRFTDVEPWSSTLEGFHRLVPPPDRFWADPFPVSRHGKHYVFFEELPFATGKGHISVIEVDREGRASRALPVLERDYHLSYPFLVEEEGGLYMVPESAYNGTIEIYRCVGFPLRWRRERVLLDGLFAADATLHRARGRWWMFASVAPHGAEIHDELHLFSADRLMGPWRAHGANPVKSDARCARPAGRLFSRGGELYRPAQVCAPLYGSGVAIHRVTKLDDEGFSEEPVRRIVPDAASGLLGLHTINRAGPLSVVDFFSRRPRFAARAPLA